MYLLASGYTFITISAEHGGVTVAARYEVRVPLPTRPYFWGSRAARPRAPPHERAVLLHNPRQLDASRCLLRSLSSFFTRDKIESLLIPIITQSDKLSLRVLDWLVTNYAKKYSVVYRTRIMHRARCC